MLKVFKGAKKLKETLIIFSNVVILNTNFGTYTPYVKKQMLDVIIFYNDLKKGVTFAAQFWVQLFLTFI